MVNTSLRAAPRSVSAARRRPWRETRDEHLGAVHPPPNRNVAVHGGGGVPGNRGVPVSAGRSLAPGGLSNGFRHRDIVGRERRDHITVFQSRLRSFRCAAARPETTLPPLPSWPGAGALALPQGWPHPRL